MPEALGEHSVAARYAARPSALASRPRAPNGAGNDPENEVQRHIRLKSARTAVL